MNLSPVTSSAEALPSFTILVVDDNRDLVEFAKLLLAHHGFNVRWAFNGAECLEIVRKRDWPIPSTRYFS
jgi:CheY-like chemotaxis protein